MADITNKLVAYIRDELYDQSHDIYKTDEQIYNKLTRYSQSLCNLFGIKQESFEITLLPDIYEYEIDDSITDLYDFEFLPYHNFTVLPILEDRETKKVYLYGEEVITTGDKLKCYARTKAGIINDTLDPDIPEDYHYLIADLVLAEHEGNAKGKKFTKKNDLYAEAKELSLNINSINRITPMPITQFKF